MTRADHRRLTALLAVGLAPLAALLVALLFGMGRSAPPPPLVDALRLPPGAEPVAAIDADSREAYSATWRQPMFSRNRQPDQAEASAQAVPMRPPGGLDGLVLTGVILTPSLQLALLKDARGNAFSLARGGRLPGGWLLESVEFDRAMFSAGEQRQSLRLSQARLPSGSADGRAPTRPCCHRRPSRRRPDPLRRAATRPE